MGDYHPNETAGPNRLPNYGPKMNDRTVASVPCDFTDSSSVEEMESEADFMTFTSRRLKRKLRRTSSSTDPQPALDTSNDITDADLQRLVTWTVRVLNIRRFGQSRCIKLVFDSETLPSPVKVGHPVRPYVPRPLQCHKCCRLGTASAVCKSEITCQPCGGFHEVDNCDAAAPLKCPNCSGAYEATSKGCPKIKQEMRVEDGKLSHPSAITDAAPSANGLIDPLAPASLTVATGMIDQHPVRVTHKRGPSQRSTPMLQMLNGLRYPLEQ
ncbi:hypothetical protein HPB52_009091 [Rhipicephalus sanguineus]|uniref:Tick transposon n=1 Tax=Rhipicephalus sanguineus TaxID=34632 RepID=A0A9D4PJL6_RHISA|nr:hypothetical protein HPB52_009091 [Rhipicephalus sanguineus]